VLRLRYGSRSILLPGDAEKQVEREILSENGAEAMHSGVLKIGHHGTNNSTVPEFLAACSRVSESYSLEKTILTDIPVRSCWNDWRMREYGY
jgi:beta-lactamase superfamily II metal-dependent hydrolase